MGNLLTWTLLIVTEIDTYFSFDRSDPYVLALKRGVKPIMNLGPRGCTYCFYVYGLGEARRVPSTQRSGRRRQWHARVPQALATADEARSVHLLLQSRLGSSRSLSRPDPGSRISFDTTVVVRSAYAVRSSAPLPTAYMFFFKTYNHRGAQRLESRVDGKLWKCTTSGTEADQ
ncbi:hypothetical protein IWX90DRAFT_439756 [Phyllosticta citrichinensis]|uniref:Uncharacterized protein n=1 Tax=Phyllosticta citrichinensis TaxID=1130410 RepID=A0ABR1XK41_9PEZI